MDICEYPGCIEERVCFHYYRQHHLEICVEHGELISTEVKQAKLERAYFCDLLDTGE